MKKISVVVVDDHRLIREMWGRIFSESEHIAIAGDSGEFDEAIEMVKQKRPDIVLLDINLQQASGMDAVPLIRKFSPGTHIIAVSMHSQLVYAKKMLQLGAKGYVTKNSSHLEIFTAIAEVMKGRVYICSEIKEILAAQVMQQEHGKQGLQQLSMREIDIIKLIKGGFSSKEIASELMLSIRTVEVHRHNILKKLQLNNAAALINYIHTTDLSFQ